MATRRMGDSLFDHGAQFFTVRDPRFRRAVADWLAKGWVTPWFEEGGHVRYRGVGGMNALARNLAGNLDVRTETKVTAVEPLAEFWRASTEDHATYQAAALLLTAPAPQSLALLETCATQLPAPIISALTAMEFDPCFALLVTLDGPSAVPAPGYLRLEMGPIEWIADNTQKGVSQGLPALTIHARADFSRQHLESTEQEVASLLLAAADRFFESHVTNWQLHRWRYSKPVHSATQLCAFADTPLPLALAGDAFAGSRIEGAFLSGLQAADHLLSLA